MKSIPASCCTVTVSKDRSFHACYQRSWYLKCKWRCACCNLITLLSLRQVKHVVSAASIQIQGFKDMRCTADFPKTAIRHSVRVRQLKTSNTRAGFKNDKYRQRHCGCHLKFKNTTTTKQHDSTPKWIGQNASMCARSKHGHSNACVNAATSSIMTTAVLRL